MDRKRYPSDLTAAQWARLEPLIPPAMPGGSPRRVDMREVMNGIFSVTREGVSWRAMPHDLPYHGTCSWYLRRFQADGTWEAINDALRQTLRVQAGRDPEPSVAIIDSQSVKTTEKGGATAATTRGRRSRGGSGTSSSIRWGCCWR
jgi:transposase